MVDILRKPKDIKKIIVHCSDADFPGYDNIETIRMWHKAKGWSDIGYHYFIDKHGKVFDGRPILKMGAHCAGHNRDSIGICVSGSKDFYDMQFGSLRFLVVDLMNRYNITRANVLPHNHFNSNKTCPNFKIQRIWKYDFENDT
jgi:N-acetyl-anhydromuramyl-L-alanine amidase AmpD